MRVLCVYHALPRSVLTGCPDSLHSPPPPAAGFGNAAGALPEFLPRTPAGVYYTVTIPC